MTNFRFQNWCRRAVSRIVLVQDRITVGRELYNHMEDQYEACLDRGSTPAEAERQALDSMGDPEELAGQLGIIHRPFEGLLLLVTRRVLRVLLVLLLFTTAAHLLVSYVLNHNYTQPVFQRYNPYTDTTVSDTVGEWHMTYRTAPNTADTSDGYTFTLTDAAQWHGIYIDSAGQLQEDDYFHFRITVTNPRPWAQYTDIVRWFRAEDSLGNTYYSAYEGGAASTLYLRGSIYHTGPMTYVCDMQLTDYVSQEAEWIDLHYDRAGRDIVLRIDLTGGSAS